MGLCISSSRLIKFLEFRGYRFIRSKGTSHNIYGNGHISVPIPVRGKKDIGEDLIRQILRETAISKNDLLEWLGRK